MGKYPTGYRTARARAFNGVRVHRVGVNAPSYPPPPPSPSGRPAVIYTGWQWAYQQVAPVIPPAQPQPYRPQTRPGPYFPANDPFAANDNLPRGPQHFTPRDGMNYSRRILRSGAGRRAFNQILTYADLAQHLLEALGARNDPKQNQVIYDYNNGGQGWTVVNDCATGPGQYVVNWYGGAPGPLGPCVGGQAVSAGYPQSIPQFVADLRVIAPGVLNGPIVTYMGHIDQWNPLRMRINQTWYKAAPGAGFSTHIVPTPETPFAPDLYPPLTWAPPIAELPYAALPHRLLSPYPQSRKVGPVTRTTPRQNPAGPTKPRKPPGPGEKEKKLRMNKVMGMFIHVLNHATEVMDVIDAFYDAIPGHPKKKLRADARARYVYTHFNEIDWDTAVFNVLWGQFISDRVWAKMGLPTKQFDRLYGQNMGVNQLINTAGGKNVSDFLKRAKQSTQDLLNRVPGLTIGG